MRENKVATHYSQNGEYRFEIIDRRNGTFQVWVQQKMCYEYMGDDWFYWGDIKDYAHLTDTVERAFEIGSEAIVNLTGRK